MMNGHEKSNSVIVAGKPINVTCRAPVMVNEIRSVRGQAVQVMFASAPSSIEYIRREALAIAAVIRPIAVANRRDVVIMDNLPAHKV